MLSFPKFRTLEKNIRPECLQDERLNFLKGSLSGLFVTGGCIIHHQYSN